MGLQEDIAKFTSLVQDWSVKTADLYYSDVAQDITVKVIDTLGNVTDITVPNQKKMQDAFTAWQASTNIKNIGGVVKADNGDSLSVDMFGGLTLAEYNSLYSTFFNKVKVRLLPDTKDTQMVGYDIMAVVTEDNKVLAWGWNSGNLLSYGKAAITNMLLELQQPNEKIGITISKLYVSGQHIGILYEDGDLYLRGIQNLGHFGIGNTATQIKFVLSAQNVVDYITSSNGDQDEQPMAAVILTDGSVMTAGDNGHGELGIGSITNTYTWTKVYDAIAYGNDSAIQCLINGDDVASFYLLTAAGKLFISGYNGFGQLGNGTTGNVSLLTQIVPNIGGAKIIKISAGGYYDATYQGHTHILTDAGRAYACGYNGQGQLGDGTVTQQNSFVEKVYESSHDVTLDPIVDIFAYCRTTAYLTQNGDLYAVGQGANGSLGDGINANTSVYKLILSNVKTFYPAVNADASQYPDLYAITNDGKLFSWGNGAYGQLGQYSTIAQVTPTEVNFAYSSDIANISHCGYANQGTVFIKLADGTLYGCGRDNYGQVSIYGRDDDYHSEFTKILL